MRVAVEFFSTFREATGSPRWEFELPAGTDLAGLLEAVFARGGSALRRATLGKDGKIAPGVSILVNGQSCAVGQGLATPLADGDVVYFLVHIAGGQGAIVARSVSVRVHLRFRNLVSASGREVGMSSPHRPWRL